MRSLVMDRVLDLANDTYLISQWQLKNMPYELYLQTEHWKHFRGEALKHYKKCQLCGGKQNLDVHHNDYVNVGCETFNDVTVICRGCHGKQHAGGTK